VGQDERKMRVGSRGQEGIKEGQTVGWRGDDKLYKGYPRGEGLWE
jgi:hypothetical protein